MVYFFIIHPFDFDRNLFNFNEVKALCRGDRRLLTVGQGSRKYAKLTVDLQRNLSVDPVSNHRHSTCTGDCKCMLDRNFAAGACAQYVIYTIQHVTDGHALAANCLVIGSTMSVVQQ